MCVSLNSIKILQIDLDLPSCEYTCRYPSLCTYLLPFYSDNNLLIQQKVNCKIFIYCVHFVKRLHHHCKSDLFIQDQSAPLPISSNSQLLSNARSITLTSCSIEIDPQLCRPQLIRSRIRVCERRAELKAKFKT